MGKRGRGSKRQSSFGVTLVAQGKGAIKRTQLSPFDAAGSDDREYFVRDIKAERLSNGVPQWLIGWKGFSNKDDTWEPIEHLAGHEQDISAFRNRRKDEVAAEEKEASAKKKRRQEEKDQSRIEFDGFEEAFGGKRRSACWKHYKVQKDDTGKIVNVKCLFCPPDNKPMPFCGNTTNLRSHLASVHKDAYCKMIVPEDGGDPPETGLDKDKDSQSSAAQGKLETMVPIVTSERRDELHQMVSLWLVRCRRPLSLPEHDQEFRDIFDFIFKGNYVPPSLKFVLHNVLLLSAEGKQRVMASLRDLLAEGILPSIGGDVWSQSGASIFGILVYWLDKEFVVHEKCLAAIPFSSVRHTAEELEKATKVACADLGLGEYELVVGEEGVIGVDTVSDHIHAMCSANGSNMTAGWKCFDGHECTDHTLALVVRAFLEHPVAKKMFCKLRGMTTHFNHSILGGILLNEGVPERSVTIFRSLNPRRITTPGPVGEERANKQATWYIVNQVRLLNYL
ncbi:hypothetical protein CYMTET_36682 [Cymbomonas tetramitiformis]|uniref:Chromo domain-containing protein n=1 Tax=Cymbomonas tetramitiformis TaxID=36881 RepID=A0AAE0F6R2_9CHLO|nr:hypothetical protein CYMTET_36682 [Cymbomonas tetramitiformis]